MVDFDVKVIPGSVGAVLRYGDVVAVTRDLGRAALAGLRETVRAAAQTDDPAGVLMTAVSDLGENAGFAAIVMASGESEVVLCGDLDVQASTLVGVTHLNASSAPGPVRQPLRGTFTRIRLGAGEGESAEGFDLEAGAVPGDGAIVVLSTAAPQASPAVRSARTMPSTAALRPRGLQTLRADLEEVGAGDAEENVAEFESLQLVGAARKPPKQSRERLPIITAASAAAADEPATSSPGGVQVQGIKCGRGHFNHPDAAHCAWCGLGMLQVSRLLVPGERPPLGVLVIDEQATFTLDADYVIGRKPAHDPEVDDDSVRQLVLSDPDKVVSRAHARIRLDGWNVLIEDKGSTLGTSLVRANSPWPQRLQPHIRHTLMPGDSVYIGNHRLTFHSHHVR